MEKTVLPKYLKIKQFFRIQKNVICISILENAK